MNTPSRDGAAALDLAAAGATVFVNPRRDVVYTEAMSEVLSDEGLAKARAVIAAWPGYAPTPLTPLSGLARALGIAELHVKDEGGRFGLGSFKALGGAYAVFRLVEAEAARQGISRPEAARTITVTCATDGNHGRSVAWGARLFGCRCVIFIHAGVSQGRKAAIEAFGAEVRRTAGNYDDSVREAQATADREGWSVVSDTSYPGYRDVPRDVMQGYEIMAAEALEASARPPTHLFLQTGVGGMAAAVTAHAWRRSGRARPTVVLADPERAACFDLSLRAGHPVAAGGDLGTLMAGLACGEVSALAWEILATGADGVVRLPDSTAVAAMRLFADAPFGDRPVVAGESAVAGLAALAAVSRDPTARAALRLDGSSRVLLFATEGDTDPDLYASLVGRSGAAVRASAEAWEPSP